MAHGNKSILCHAIEEIFNHRRVDLIPVHYSPDCQGKTPDGPFHGHDGVRALFETYTRAFPDFCFFTHRIVGEDDLVIVQYTFTGTNTGTLGGAPATGLTFQIPGVIVSRISQSRIVEQTFIWDNLAPRRQVRQAALLEQFLHRGDGARPSTGRPAPGRPAPRPSANQDPVERGPE